MVFEQVNHQDKNDVVHKLARKPMFIWMLLVIGHPTYDLCPYSNNYTY